MPIIVFRIGREPWGACASDVVPSCVPSTMIDAPQCLQVMRARLPRTRSSGTAYFAGHAVQATFIGLAREAKSAGSCGETRSDP
jgi:hypothetical protein